MPDPTPAPGPAYGSATGAEDLRVAYVMTDYPRLAMTFITGEVDEIERQGVRVVPIAMNEPTAHDIADDDGRRRHDLTLYLKSNPRRVAVELAKVAARHPGRLARLACTAVTSARGDVTIIARRLAHLAYAPSVVARCRATGVRHLHAHFGQSPATIAWFAALVGRWDETDAWTWSFTIHGFQDFVDDKDARLDLKARSASFIVCISDFTRSQLCRVSDPATWERFHVVRCGLDLERWPRRDVAPDRARPVVTTVARLSAEKGHGVLLEACALLRSQHDLSVQVELIGDGPFADELHRLAGRLDLTESVTFLGQLPSDQVAKHLASSDVFCLPSFSEGLPISIMEAMALGVPVVCTGISGIPELAIEGVTAHTVPPGNAPALAAALARTLTGDGQRERLVDAGRELVERNHDRPSNVGRLRALLSVATAAR